MQQGQTGCDRILQSIAYTLAWAWHVLRSQLERYKRECKIQEAAPGVVCMMTTETNFERIYNFDF